MKATEMLDFLQEFYADKRAMWNRHVAAAQHVTHYDFNNTYQYVIAREDMHVRWVADAITDLGAQLQKLLVVVAEAAGLRRAAARAGDHVPAVGVLDAWPSRPRVGVHDSPAAQGR